jgi:hypothetical protein
MDASTFNTVSKTAKVTKQKAKQASAGQTGTAAIDNAQVKRDRKAKQTAKAALHNAQQGHDDSKLGRRKTRYAKGQFPFLRLPAEVRNRVVRSNMRALSFPQGIPLTHTFCSQQYKLALKSPRRCTLKTFKLPPLLKVCRQVRHEASGLFTKVNGFDFSVRTNYVPFAENAEKTPLFSPDFGHYAGQLQLDDGRREFLEDDKIVFRDLSIMVYGAHSRMNFVGFFGVTCEITKGQYAVSFGITNGRHNLEYVGKMFANIKGDIEGLLSEAQARPGFAGLKFSDLEKIAKFFDYFKGE